MATKTATKPKKEKVTLVTLRERAASAIRESDMCISCRRGYSYSRYVPFSWTDENVENKIIEAIPEPKTPMFEWSYSSKGQERAVFYCPSCDHVFDSAASNRGGYNLVKCSHCGASLSNIGGTIVRFDDDTSTFNCDSRSGYHYVVIDVDAVNGYAVIVRFEYIIAYHSIPHSGTPTLEAFRELSKNYSIGFMNANLYVYHAEYGLRQLTDKGLSSKRIYLPNGEFLKTPEYSNFAELLNLQGVSVDETVGIDHSCLKELSKVETKSSVAAAERKKEKDKIIDREDELYANFESSDAERIIKDHFRGVHKAFLYDTKGSQHIAIMACPSCGAVSTTDIFKSENEQKAACPHCGEILTVDGYYHSYWGSDTALFTDWGVCSDGSLIATEYRCTNTINIESKEIKQEVKPVDRYVYRGNSIIMYRYTNTSSSTAVFTRDSAHRNSFGLGCADGPNYQSKDIVNFYRSRDDLKNVISKSVLAKSGFIEALGLDDASNLTPVATPCNANLYLLAYKECPIVELLVKCKMYNLAHDVMVYVKRRDEIPEFTKATTIQEAFGLNKATFKWARVNDLNLSEVLALKHHYNFDQSMSYADFDWSKTTYGTYTSSSNVVVQLMEGTGCSLKRVREYITTCYYNQCIDYAESARLWVDYIGMMRKLKFSDRQFKKELFPRSLKKAHDVLNFATKNIVDESNFSRFTETVEGAKKYRYTFGDYLLTTPESAEDIIKEGIDLNHSVVQHIELVVDKREYICFIRRKSDPETPFYTVELIGKDIVQIRGNSNCPVQEEDVKTFIKKWAKFKKLNIKSL